MINLSSSAHDVLQQQKLAALLEGDCDSPVKVDLVSELLKSTRTSSGKIKMLLDIVECPRLRIEQVRDVVDGMGEVARIDDVDDNEDYDEEEEQQKRNRRPPQNLSNCVAALRKMLDLFEFLSSVAKEEEVPKLSGECSAKDAKAALGCDEHIAQKISSVLQGSPIRSYPC